MKITKISIKNYRSCLNVTFEPHRSISAFIGPNGSGKTNILSAMRLLPALCANRSPTFATNEPTVSLSEIKTTYELDGKKVIHTASLNLVTNESNKDEIISSHEEWYLFDFTGSRAKVSIPSWIIYDIARDKSILTPTGRKATHLVEWLRARGIEDSVVAVLERIVQFVGGISYYGASQFTNPGSSPISFEVEGTEGDSKRRTGISITGHKRFLYDVYQAKRRVTPQYQEFISLVGTTGIGLVDQIDFEEIKTSSSNYSVMTGGKFVKREKTNLLVIPRFNIAGNSLSPSQLSEGTFKTLALVFYLVTDTSSILMIEEPEVCVHHGLLASIVELIGIYSKDKQIFVSTHSDAVLDKLEIQNVFKVRRDPKSGTSVSNIKKSLKNVELAALKDYLLNQGSLGEYWKHGDLENV